MNIDRQNSATVQANDGPSLDRNPSNFASERNLDILNS